jgi:short-subunit dehydrogenase
MAFADMREQRSGSIINVASIAAHQPITYMTTYAATKAFVHSFSQALAAEAKDFNVQVMSHCPGPTESEFHLVSGLSEKMNHLPSMTALEVVREALQADKRKIWVCINGLKNKFLAFTGKVTPGPIAARITKKVLYQNVNSKK